MNLHSNNDAIEQVSSHRILGVTVDHALRWHLHINNVCKQMSRNLYLLNKLKYYVKADARKLFFHAHCMSILNYASTVWSGAADVHIQKLDSLYNRGAKLILFEKSLASSEKHRLLDMLPLKEHFKYCKAIFMFKVDKGRSPSYLKVFFKWKQK